MIDRRTLLAGALGLGALGVLSGCDAGGADATGKGGVPGSWVRCRVPSPEAIDPLFVCDEGGLRVCSLVFDTLTKIEPGTGAVLPLACTSFEMFEDCRTFTFHLPAGAVFHDGEAVTAAAFKRAWERLTLTLLPMDTPAGAAGTAPVASPFTRITGVLKRSVLTCVDDLTFRVELSEPFVDFPALVSHPILGPVPRAAEDDLEGFGTLPIGNGPFKLIKPWKGDQILLERFEGYAIKSVGVEGAVLALSSDTHAAFKRFQSGALDVCDVPVDLYDETEDASGLSEDGRTVSPGRRFVRSAGPGVFALAFNDMQLPLDAREVREALACAIDREALCQKIMKDSAVPAASPVSPAVAATDPWPGTAYDPDRAAELLEPLYPADEDGARPLEVTLLHRKGGVLGRMAAQVARDLKAVGITAKTAAAEPGEYAGRRAEEGVSCVLEYWQPDIATLEESVRMLYPGAQEQGGLAPAAGLVPFDEQVYTLLANARAERDDAARAALMREALAKMGENLAFTPLAHPVHAVAASERVTSLVVDVYGHAELARAILA